MTRNARVPLTTVNVAYSDFMKKSKNWNMHRMLTRSTFAHAQNDAGSTFHSLVSIPCPFLKKCAWNTNQTMNSRFLNFCAKSECASGTRLVHVSWFLMIFTKINLFEKWLETHISCLHTRQWKCPTVRPNALFSCGFWSIQASLNYNGEALGYNEDVRRCSQMLCFPAVSKAVKPP